MKYSLLCLFFLLSIQTSIHSQANEADSMAMVDFYNAMDGDNWKYNDNWLTSTPLNDWYGINLNNNRIVSLSMRNNQCKGMVNSSLGNCSGLKFLYLDQNEITGISDMDSLKELQFVNISSNLLPEFPAFLLKCEKLEELNLYDNVMQGNIPPELNNLTKLKKLYLTQNQFSGQVPSLKELTNLTIFDLSINKELEGDLKDILNDTLALDILTFSYTNISGDVLPTYFNSESLLRLFADSTKVTAIDKLDSLTFARLWIRHTDLGFGQLMAVSEQNILDIFYYSPQNMVPGPDDMAVAPGSNITLTCNIEDADDYQWYKDDEFIQGEKSIELEIMNFSMEDAAQYHCIGTNESLPLLTLEQTPTTLTVGTTHTSDNELNDVELFPNPASHVLMVRGSEVEGGHYHIYSQSGRLIQEGILFQNKIAIDDLATGYYFLDLQSKDQRIHKKLHFIKQ